MSLESINVWPLTPVVSPRAVSAAQTLRSYVWTKGGAKKDRELKALAEKVPGCKWSDYLRLHLFYRTDWGDSTSPSIGTVASFQGCQQAIDNAMLLITSLRAEQQAIASVERKVNTLYRVVVALEHVSSYSLVAWLDVETGLVDPHGRPWLEAEEKRLAAASKTLTEAQLNGTACVVCGGNGGAEGMLPLGVETQTSTEVFHCCTCTPPPLQDLERWISNSGAAVESGVAA